MEHLKIHLGNDRERASLEKLILHFENVAMSALQEFHRNNQARMGRMNKAIMNYHANAEREQKKEQERIEKERMRRLMAEDEEGYRKLIDQKKDKRLAFLLSQTDEYIGNLTEMVKQHKVEQKKKQADEMVRKKRWKRELLQNGEYMSIDESCQAADLRVTVMDPSTGQKLQGEEAPMLRDLHRWLEAHPGWEWVESESDLDSDEEEERRKEKKEAEDNQNKGDKTEEDKTKEMIKKAKVSSYNAVITFKKIYYLLKNVK